MSYRKTILTEEELLIQLSERDPAAFQALIELYFPVLCQFAGKFLPDTSLAKDVVQETFIKCWKAGLSFTSIKVLKGYLFAATRNGCLNLLRSRDRQESRIRTAYRDTPEEVDPILTEVVQAEYIALIYKVVQDLSPVMQEIFRLSYEEGLTVREIAARLDMKLKTVKNHKYKTLLHLRGKLGGKHGPLLVLLTTLLR